MRQINEKSTIRLAGQGNIIRYAHGLLTLESYDIPYKANRSEDQEAAYRSFLHPPRIFFLLAILLSQKNIEDKRRNPQAGETC